MPDDTQHWCPVHGLHGKWHNGWCAKEEPPGSNEYCMHDPIAPEIVQAIEARAIARERIRRARIAEVRAPDEHAAVRVSAMHDVCTDGQPRALALSIARQIRDQGFGPDYVAQHDARVRREALEWAADDLEQLEQGFAARRLRALAQQEDTE